MKINYIIKELEDVFPQEQIILDKEKLKKEGSSPYNISPSLKILERAPDVIVKARDEEDIRKLVDLCSKHNIPLIPYGNKSGTLGQTIPIYGGIMVDIKDFKGIIELKNNSVSLFPGTKIIDVLKELESDNKELMVFPSSYHIATVGGYIGAGNVGIGAFQYGYFYHKALLSAKIIAPKAEIELRGDDILSIAQAAGTTGVVTRAEFSTVNKEDWEEQVVFCKDISCVIGTMKLLLSDPMKTRRVTIEDYETFTRVTSKDGDRWNVILSSRLKLGTRIDKIFDTIAFAAIYVYFNKKNPFKNYHYEAKLIDLKSFLEISTILKNKLGSSIMIHGDVMIIKSQPIVYAVFMSDVENFDLIMSLLRDYGYYYNLHSYQINDYHEDPYVMQKIIELKRKVDPLDILNRGKLRF